MKHIALKKNRDFQHVYKKGKSYAGKYMVIFLLKNNAKVNRLGVSVNKKMGHAVARNRIRRRLKEAFKLLDAQIEIAKSYDLIILPRLPIANAAFADIKSQMAYLLRKHGLHSNSHKGES